MSNFPTMVYLNGERGKHIVVNNAKQMILAAEDNMFPMGVKSKEDVISLDYIVAELKAEQAAKDKKKTEDELIQSAINTKEALDKALKKIDDLEKKIDGNTKDNSGNENQSLEQIYETETGKNAIIAGGVQKGKETPSFIEWKKNREK